ncbi:MAG: glycosyltransferase family 9 protein [Flavobacteriales bacterium]|nr:glycosyltransferase family 9 protein [Flavobacteriales bacterium]
MQEKIKVLVIRFSSIGDIVLTTPVLRALETQLDGDVEIHYLTKSAMKPILEHNPRIHTIHTIEKATGEVLPELLALEFDYVVDLHRNVRSAMVKRKLKMLDFTFEKRNWEKWLLVRFGINKLDPKEHVVDRYLNTLAPFGVKSDGKGLEYYLPKELEQKAAPSEAYTALVLGATHEGKQLSEAQWSEIVKKTDSKLMLLGGKAEAALGEALEKGNAHVQNMAGKCSLHESAYYVKHADLVITGDTGLMHIASAFNKIIISVWGCTSPALQMSPYHPNALNVIIEPENHPKRPCSKLGDRCKYGKGEKRCITSISADRIVSAIKAIKQKSF